MIEKETILEFLCRKELEKILEGRIFNGIEWRKIIFINNLNDFDA